MKGEQMEVKRLKRVLIGESNAYTDFMKKKGLLIEFLISIGRHCYEQDKINGKTIVDDIDRTIKHRAWWSPEQKYEKIIIDDEVFYLCEKWFSNNNQKYYIYMEVPLIIDDENFIWKTNFKYNSKEATITRGMFEYQCIINADGNGKVIVRYVKCENFHRNKVTIAEFDVPNAYNEVFLEEINRWNKENTTVF